MGSLYITISVPSADYEKKLRAEKSNGQSEKSYGQSEKKLPSCNIQPDKSAGDMCNGHVEVVKTRKKKMKLVQSVSDEILVNDLALTPEFKERSDSTGSTPINKSQTSMEEKLEECLKELKIPNAVWVLGRAGKYYQVSFCTPAGEQCEHIVELLNEHKIGIELNSTVSILPCSLYYDGKEHTLSPAKTSPSVLRTTKSYIQGVKEFTAWQHFVNSVRARLMVAQVVAGVKSNAVFTFDFLILLIIAALTAAIGLVENSVVILVASMLLSPLMGPVMASTFGFATKDWKLQKIGMMNELLGLLLCLLIGFLYGLTIGYLSWESPTVVWPTPEMVTRGDLRSLWVGALIAILSGIAVAIAVLGNYSCSLSGVAISASLMPPAVNAGLLWALALMTVILGDSTVGRQISNRPQQLSVLSNTDPVQDLIILGALSLALTFINILFIFLAGIIVLKVKEVNPNCCKDYSRSLWRETMQIARDYKYNMPGTTEGAENGSDVSQQFTEIFAETQSIVQDVNEDSKTGGLAETLQAACGKLRDPNRHTMNDLASLWKDMEFSPSIDSNQGTQQGITRKQAARPKLVHQWSGLNNHSPTYMNLHEEEVPPTRLIEGSVKTGQKRFTVTPTSVQNVY